MLVSYKSFFINGIAPSEFVTTVLVQVDEINPGDQYEVLTVAYHSSSSKYRAFYITPNSAVSGPVEFHIFSKWKR
jgi:hypothetical protein